MAGRVQDADAARPCATYARGARASSSRRAGIAERRGSTPRCCSRTCSATDRVGRSYLRFDRPLGARRGRRAIATLVARGAPRASRSRYLVGRARVLVAAASRSTPDVLIPRPETELLVETRAARRRPGMRAARARPRHRQRRDRRRARARAARARTSRRSTSRRGGARGRARRTPARTASRRAWRSSCGDLDGALRRERALRPDRRQPAVRRDRGSARRSPAEVRDASRRLALDGGADGLDGATARSSPAAAARARARRLAARRGRARRRRRRSRRSSPRRGSTRSRVTPISPGRHGWSAVAPRRRRARHGAREVAV